MKKWIWIGVLVLLVVAAGIAFYILSQPPKEKLSDEFKKEAVTKLLGRKAQLDNKNIPTGDTKFEGKYITFSYPAKALIYTFRENARTKDSSTLEDLSFDIKEPKLIFNMQITDKGDYMTVSDIPSARLRDTRSEYKKGEFKLDGQSGVSYFSSGTDPEKSGFVLANGKLYTFSVTGSVAEDVEGLFNKIIASAKFK